MNNQSEPKTCIFIGSSLKDLKRFPAKVQNRMGFALNQVQQGGEPIAAKALRGFGGRTVLELIDDFDSARIGPFTPYVLLEWCMCCTLSRRKQKGASLHRSRISILLSRACVMPNCIIAHAPTTKDISYDET